MAHSGNGKVSGEKQDTEVVAKAKRRQYSYEYKERILAEIEACTQPGAVGAILRREGLYSQVISKWRQQLRNKGPDGLKPQPRGPKADPQSAEWAQLRRENERLRQRLERAELIIEVQKKVSGLLGLPTEPDLDEPK